MMENNTSHAIFLILEIMKLGGYIEAVTPTTPNHQQETQRQSDRDREPFLGEQGKVSTLQRKYLVLGEILKGFINLLPFDGQMVPQ